MTTPLPAAWDFLTETERRAWYAVVRHTDELERVCYGNGHALLRPESPIPWLADIPDRPLKSPFGNRAPEPITQPEPDRDTGLTLALLNVRGMVLAGMDAIDICDALDSALALLREKQS